MNGKDNFILGWNTNNLKENSINAFHELVKLNKNADYWFGYLGYDLKNSTLPKTNSTNIDIHNFQDVNFFKADNVIIKKNNQYLFYGSIDDFTSLNKKIAFRNNSYSFKKFHNSIELIATTSKNEYLEKIKQIKYHIQNGDTYENANFSPRPYNHRNWCIRCRTCRSAFSRSNQPIGFERCRKR